VVPTFLRFELAALPKPDMSCFASFLNESIIANLQKRSHFSENNVRFEIVIRRLQQSFIVISSFFFESYQFMREGLIRLISSKAAYSYFGEVFIKKSLFCIHPRMHYVGDNSLITFFILINAVCVTAFVA
jgi:hypothetical protein